MVNIALGNAALNTCPSGDLNDDREITIDEIIQAVNVALHGTPRNSGGAESAVGNGH
jgi:hypothetical protein